MKLPLFVWILLAVMFAMAAGAINHYGYRITQLENQALDPQER